MVGLDVHTTFHLLLALGLHLLQNCLNNLVGDVRHVRASADGADGVHKAHLLEAGLREAETHLPPVRATLKDLRNALACQQVEVRVVAEVFDVQLLPVQEDHAALGCGTRDVVHALCQQGHDIVIQRRHSKFGEIRPKCDPGVGLILAVHHTWCVPDRHVFLEHLREPLLSISCLHFKAQREYVGELGSIAIAPADYLAVGIVVVVTCQQVTKHHLWDVHLVFLMDHDGKALAIVPNRNGAFLRVNVHLEGVHALRVPHEVICSVDEDFIHDLVECRNVGNLAVDHTALHPVKHPEVLRLRLCAAYIGVRPEEDVLELGLLLVDLLYCLALAPSNM
mmetsp:Transcript_50874/g.162822  ORF Transcript_50874/g.162822 Transcript_50874/m.162822 type:complete len:336 (+) Transcript_50874:2293-3300(+)